MTQDKNALIIDVTLFVRRGELFKRLTETHVQYAHGLEDVRRIMLDAGYAHVDVYDCFTMNEATGTSERIQFFCIKE